MYNLIERINVVIIKSVVYSIKGVYIGTACRHEE